MLRCLKLLSAPPQNWKQAPFTEPEPTQAVSEEGDEQINNWLELADAALNDEEHAA